MPAMNVVRPLRWFVLLAAVISVSACPSTEPKVDDLPFSIDLAPDTSVVQSGLTVQLTTTVKNKAGDILTGKDIVFASEDSTVAKVSEAGVVTGARAGTATIDAAIGTLEATAIVKVGSGAPSQMTKVGDAPTTPVVGASGNV